MGLADRFPGHARTPEYDLASLAYDGYAVWNWSRLGIDQGVGKDFGQPPDDRIFRACALQRLMQMLGAYPTSATTREKPGIWPRFPPGWNTCGSFCPAHACRTAGGHASMIFLPAPDDADPRFLLVLSLFQISLGLGWIRGTCFFRPPFSVMSERRNVPCRRVPDRAPEGLNAESKIVLQPYDYFNKGQTAQLPVVSLHRESSLNSFAAYPPNPMDYGAVPPPVRAGGRNVYVMAPMAWEEEPDSIVKAAVGYELDRFLHKALGRQMSESARRSPLPPDWKDLIIPASNIVGKTDQFPRADRFVGEPPQITTSAPSLGTVVENNELFSPAPENRVSPPLFIRWGGRSSPPFRWPPP
ncbi:MAG: hypothetical protein ACLT8E_06000 [Akkermansia sp.]